MTKPATFLGAHPWWQSLKPERKTFISPLARAECVQRLKAAIDPMFAPLGPHKAQGHVKDDSAVVRRRIYYRNSFQTRATMTFRDQGTGTRIEAEYGAAWMVILFATVFAIVAVLAAVAIVVTQAPPAGGGGMTIIPFVLFPIVFTIGLGITILFLRSAALADKAFLDDFIGKTLDAKEA